MSTMLAKAKTIDELRADIDRARDAFLTANLSKDRRLKTPNAIARVEARVGHLWHQYVAAIYTYANAYVRGITQ